jgi:hypothetical protein
LDRKEFWKKIFNSKLANSNYVFIRGDLNFTLGDYEILGPTTQKDPISDFFIEKLDEAGLFDIQTIKYNPTWRNLRLGDESVEKRLDIFLRLEPFL